MSRLNDNPLWRHLLLPLCLLLLCHAGPSFAERADRNQPMHLEANSVNVDDTNQISTFEGNVQLLQGSLSIQADKIVITQDKGGFYHCTATGQLAHFRQKRDGENEYVEGYGERIEYDTHSEVAEFFGQARIKREGDDVRGEHIVYSTRTEVFKVNGTHDVANSGTPGTGRVTIVIQPHSTAADSAAETPPAAASSVSASGVAAPSSVSDGAPLHIKPATTITKPGH
jgi:lipopolysaccharide export system protein LptA